VRIGVINKVTIRLSERSWKTLERRFDLGNEGPKFTIDKPCICDYYNGCIRCPLFVFPGSAYPNTRCMTGLEWLLGEPRAFEVYISRIEWNEQNDEVARKQIEKVHTFLVSMKREAV